VAVGIFWQENWEAHFEWCYRFGRVIQNDESWLGIEISVHLCGQPDVTGHNRHGIWHIFDRVPARRVVSLRSCGLLIGAGPPWKMEMVFLS
jgi:hypothetical protein